MSDTQTRLIRCFQAVFPELTESQAVRASVSRTNNWDSLASVTLIAAVEEEFGIQFDGGEIEQLNSFQRFLDRLG
jgi:acyl carrier protein